MNKSITNILLVGMGGQGIITASRVLGAASLLQGYDVKTTEVHGMAQRGGAVDAHIRFGSVVHSPIIPQGQLHILVAFEELEAIRWAHFIKPGGLILLYPERRIPATADRKTEKLPCRDALERKEFFLEVVKPKQAIEFRCPNIFMLGRLACELEINEKNWKKAIEMTIKPSLVANAYKEFREGKGLLKGDRKVITA